PYICAIHGPKSQVGRWRELHVPQFDPVVKARVEELNHRLEAIERDSGKPKTVAAHGAGRFQWPEKNRWCGMCSHCTREKKAEYEKLETEWAKLLTQGAALWKRPDALARWVNKAARKKNILQG
ncbi:hypothetical protein HK405_000818, partial [Cladochytrium tenue]